MLSRTDYQVEYASTYPTASKIRSDDEGSVRHCLVPSKWPPSSGGLRWERLFRRAYCKREPAPLDGSFVTSYEKD